MESAQKTPPPAQPPTIAQMAANAAAALARHVAGGGRVVDAVQLAHREAVCLGCEFFNATGVAGMFPRCMHCGCSTWAKQRMATEKCPLDKWGAIPAP